MNQALPLSQTARPHQSPQRVAAGGLGFDALMTLLASWVVAGLFIDGWAHTHGQVDATFFTPWHGLLYAGLAAVLGVLGATLAVNRRAGRAWRQVLPAGYSWSLVGALLFGAAGLADLLWHTLFGFEANFEALASPPHLLLVAGVWLIVGGPLRAAWQRPTAPRTWPEQLPAVLSLTFLLSLLTFFTAQAQPIPNPGFWGGPAPARAGDAALLQEMGMTSLLLSTAVLSGMLLFLLRRWQPRPGTLTLILTLNGVAMSALYDGPAPLPMVSLLAAVTLAGAGLAGDLLLGWLRPSPARPGRLRLVAVALPMLVTGGLLLTLHLTVGLWWTVHLWAGGLVQAGLVGLLLSYLLAPPVAPSEPEHVRLAPVDRQP